MVFVLLVTEKYARNIWNVYFDCFVMINKNRFQVCILCMTYNQSVYITDALNGFAIQQTNFPFVAVVVDDASTDGEQEVIKAYVDEYFDHSEETGYKQRETEDAFWTLARHAENKNCHFAVVLLKKNLFGNPKKDELIKDWMDSKYIACCEGDDYWTDPLKLQKQISFLESHPDFSMCFHGAEVRVENNPGSEQKNGTNYSKIEDREYESTEFVSSWLVPTASIVYRPENVNQFKVKHPERVAFGDIVLVLKCSHTGKVFGMSDMMSVYRIQPNSITNNPQSVDSLIYKLPDHYRCLRENFPKVEKGPLEWSISHYYYVRMKKQRNIVLKARDFLMFIWWNPRIATHKMKSVLQRRFRFGSKKSEIE